MYIDTLRYIVKIHIYYSDHDILTINFYKIWN